MSPLMDDGVDEEVAAALLTVVDVVEELTRVSSRVVKRKKIKPLPLVLEGAGGLG